MSEDDIPPIPELTVGKMNQLICADYLEALAKMIRRGVLSSFDLVWNTNLEKPAGKIINDASVLIAPVEVKIRSQIADYQLEQSRKISVTDLSEELKDHEPCEDEECALCSDKRS